MSFGKIIQLKDITDSWSSQDALDTEANRDDKTEQHHAKDADINVIVARFGLNADFQGRAPMFGTVNYDDTLHNTMVAIDEARAVYNNLPTDIKNRYNTDDALIAALADGSIARDIYEHNKKEALRKNPIAPPPAAQPPASSPPSVAATGSAPSTKPSTTPDAQGSGTR